MPLPSNPRPVAIFKGSQAGLSDAASEAKRSVYFSRLQAIIAVH